MTKQVRLIAAIDDKRGIAKNGRIPWTLPSDQKRWRELTLHKHVVLGTKTYEKLEPAYALNRHLYVVSYKTGNDENVQYVQDLPAFIEQSEEDIWVIGGGQIFTLALPFATELLLTRVQGDFACDTYFPAFEESFQLEYSEPPQAENGISFYYQSWKPRAAE
jgi:dihydrofolate reductase